MLNGRAIAAVQKKLKALPKVEPQVLAQLVLLMILMMREKTLHQYQCIPISSFEIEANTWPAVQNKLNRYICIATHVVACYLHELHSSQTKVFTSFWSSKSC